MLTLLFLALACWCWLGQGPYFLRWPAVVIVVILTSGHPLAGMAGEDFEQLVWPLLTLFFALLGLWIIIRGVFGPPRPRHYHHHPRYGRYGRYGRRWRYDRW